MSRKEFTLMRASQFFISTLKEAPADAEIISHKLMVRTGMIRRLGSGIYAYMPMGLRVIRKIENIIRDEMVRAGADRIAHADGAACRTLAGNRALGEVRSRNSCASKISHMRDFVLQPTFGRGHHRRRPPGHQEPGDSCRSISIHIQTKFRDERRPRFGVMRGREFTMKDCVLFRSRC